VTSSPAPTDLTTVADVQAWLNLQPSQDADVLQRLVSAASVMIQSYIGYNIAPTAYRDVRSGNGRNVLFLKCRPVISVESVTVGNVAQVASPAYGKPGYAFDEDSVYLTGGAFSPGFKNVSIAYTAGYADTPLDLAQACIELVSFRYKLKDKTGFVAEGALGQTTSYSQRDMPASVITALQTYVRVF
jgi:hypothetical protein